MVPSVKRIITPAPPGAPFVRLFHVAASPRDDHPRRSGRSTRIEKLLRVQLHVCRGKEPPPSGSMNLNIDLKCHSIEPASRGKPENQASRRLRTHQKVARF